MDKYQITQIIPSHLIEEDVFIIPERVRITFNRAWKTALKANTIPHTKYIILKTNKKNTEAYYILKDKNNLITVNSFSCQLNENNN